MYPAQTSFIPVQIALTRFLEKEGIKAIFLNYPYWYKGSTPFRYLTGPVVPFILVFLHQLLPGLNLFGIMFGLIGVFWLIGGVGLYKLSSKLKAQSSKIQIKDQRLISFLAAGFYVLGPIVPFLFPFSDGLSLISFSFLPWILFFYLRFLKQPKLRNEILVCILISFAILIKSSIIPSLILALLALLLSQKSKKIEARIKKLIKIFFISILISTAWYGPRYWYQLVFSPSFGGKPLFKIIGLLGQLLPLSLALVLGFSSQKFIKSQNKAIKFAFLFTFIFLFLTLIRFLSDPDFWLDWSNYGLELQMGLAIGVGIILGRLGRWGKIILITVYCLLFTTVFNQRVLKTLQLDVNQSLEYRLGQELDNLMTSGERVFLSGTPVFWLNAFFDLNQVRGGKDEVSLDPNWRSLAWEIREGEEIEKTIQALKGLEVSFLVVHTEKSQEFFHDFKNIDKFKQDKRLKKVYQKDGDLIYQLE